MNEKALTTLEFHKITAMLAERAISPKGKVLAAGLKPHNDAEIISRWQKETSEAVSMILKKGSLPLGGIKEIGDAVKRADIGGSLSAAELLHVADFLYVCRKVGNYVKAEGRVTEHELLDPLFAQLENVPELEKEITRCIVSEVEISDDASSALSSIRRGLRAAGDKIKDQLSSIIQSQSYKNMLQDSVITIRNDRYCVPVKTEYRGSFPGMMHDQSGSGATVFIEPMAVVQLNNKIKELHAEEKAEIERILYRLSGMVADKAEILVSNEEILTHLDFVFAKGELSLAMNGTEPVFNSNGYINIKKGRHPLLDKQTVVPTDIYLGRDFTTLLITGPNTGGKTVSLKTLGLFTLMGQAGLHIAAFDNSELAVFDDVFADIGDEQSIEQSLSTFSSHMSNIVRILGGALDNSLVLLDELGAGTDPTEGAALAIAILEHLHSRKIRSAVTTHYSELKVYALSTDGVENASCEFNVETLRPTYKLLIGIPGKSNAFAISQKLGLPEHIISSAKELISQESARFEDVITDLEISRKTVILEQERAESFRREAEKMRADWENQKRKLSDQRDKILLEAKDEARRMMQGAKEEADRLIKEMSRMQNHRDMDENRKKIREKLNVLDDEISAMHTPKENARPAPKELRKGDKVYVNSMNQYGAVVTPPDASGQVLVQAGIMKFKVPLKDLSIDEREEPKQVAANVAARAKAGKSQYISPEIDLRGCLVDEALERCDKYLDDAYLAGLGAVTIIHGKGTGALRTAIQNHLRMHPHVKTFRLGTFGEGEHGVSIAELKH